MRSSVESMDSESSQNKRPAAPVLLNVIVAAVAIGAGIATPFWVQNYSQSSETLGTPVTHSENLDYIEFGAVTANLDEPNLTRYLKVNLSLAVHKQEKHRISQLIDNRKMPLRDWLTSYFASQTMESIRGRSGHNRLRREIRDYLNNALFSGNAEPIHGVLFLEFNVQ